MSRSRRIATIFFGLLTLLMGLIMLVPYKYNYLVVLFLMECSLILAGVRQLFYYFTMAKFMVGGIYIFYKGIFLLDAGLFTLNMDDVPQLYAMLYLIVGMTFTGVVSILHALQNKRIHSSKWKYPLMVGVVEILSSIICLIFLNDPDVLAVVYGLVLIHSGGARIVTALRPSAIVYIN